MMQTFCLLAWLTALQASRGGALASSYFDRDRATQKQNVLTHDHHHHDEYCCRRCCHRRYRHPFVGTSSKLPFGRTLPVLTTAVNEDNSNAINNSNRKDQEDNNNVAAILRGGSTQPAPNDDNSNFSTLSSSSSPPLPPPVESSVKNYGIIAEKIPSMPTLAQYIKFALPCLGLWIAGPLLSLVDTSFVGLSGSSDTSAQQLAALGPATTFMDGATYLFAFLNVATTNLYSSARAAADHIQDNEDGPDLAAESVVRTAARVSLRCGVGIMIFLLAVCKPLLRLYIGEEAIKTPGLLQSATDYVMIRALHMPTSLLLGVLQAALLGAKDSVTPLIAILYSTIINVAGDYLLVNRFKMGLQGAAIATTFAQWASTIALIGPARRELVHDHNLGIFRKPKDNTHVPKNGDSSDMVTSKSFLSFAAPVLTLILGKLAAFGFMTNAAAGVPGQPTPLASHQIILSLLFFCSPFLEVISQTAQTFLPPFLAPLRNYMERNKITENDVPKQVIRPWKNAALKVCTELLGLSFIAAAGIASLASLVPAYFGGMLTSDTTVQQAVKPLAKYLWLGAFAWAPVAVGEGVLLAQRHLGFLAVIYLLSTAMLPPALLLIKLRKGSVGQVWLLFGLFQIFRALCFTGRIWWGPWIINTFFKKKASQEDAIPASA